MKAWTLAAALAAATTCTLTASADDADALFQRGRALVQQHKYAEACPLLGESVKLDPGIGAMLWLGECYEKNGQLASAFAEFKVAAAAAAERKDDRARVALRRANTIEPKLACLVIALTASEDGREIKRDGVVVPAAEIGVPQPIDPGVHTIAASAAGHTSWSVAIPVPNQPDVVTVNVPLLDVAVTPVAPAPAEPSPGPTIVAAPILSVTPHPALSAWKITAFGVGVLGVAALGGGAFLGLEAKAKYGDSNQNGHCLNNACDPIGRSDRSDATRLAGQSTAAFLVGAGAVAAGIVVFIVSPSTSVAPTVGGATLVHRF